jgi:GTPase SAR1 family protein
MTGTKVLDDYGRYFAKRDALISIGEDLRQVFELLSIPTWCDLLDRESYRLRNEHFRLLVIGDFNTGKTTLINALLGRELLPSWAVETTAIINEIKWGASEAALIHFKDGSTQQVPIAELESYVALPPETSNPHDCIKEAPYSKIEIFWPLELCRNGVEIIDSPGLNAHELREKITLEYLSSVDAILFVMDCTRLGTANELRVVDTVIRPAGHEDIFFVANKVNMLRRDEDIRRVKGIARIRLGERTKRGERGVFFVNALGALEGRANADEGSVNQSGILALEQDLAQYLTDDLGGARLGRSARRLIEGLRLARELIPQQIDLLEMNLATFVEREQTAETRLLDLDAERRALLTHMSNSLAGLKAEVKSLARRWMEDIVACVPDWARQHRLANTIRASLTRSPAAGEINRVSTELTTALFDRMQDGFTAWQMHVLQPAIQRQVAGITAGLNASTAATITAIGRQSDSPDTEPDTEIGDGRGIARTGPSTAIVRRVVPQLSIWTPEVLRLMMATVLESIRTGSMLSHGADGRSHFFEGAREKFEQAVNEAIKEKTAGHFADWLTSHASEHASAIAEIAAQELASIHRGWDQALAAEIGVIRDQLAAARSRRERGGVVVEGISTQLRALHRNLQAIDSQLEDLALKAQ